MSAANQQTSDVSTPPIIVHNETDASDSSYDSPDRQSPANIINALNNDCLMDIFEWLDLKYLNVLAHVCRRFRSIAISVFQRKFKNELFTGHRFYDMAFFIDCIRIFAPRSVSIDGHFDHIHNSVLRAILEYCPDLQELGICTSNIVDAQILADLRLILPKLRYLTIVATDILSDCGEVDWQLQELQFTLGRDLAMPTIKTPLLTKIRIKNEVNNRFIDKPPIFEYLARNYQVTTLELVNWCFTLDEWCTLFQCAPNIRELTMITAQIEDANIDNQGMDIFQYLTECSPVIECSIRFLRPAPLQRVKLSIWSDAFAASEIDNICQLKTITSLFILQSTNTGNIVNMNDDVVNQLTRSLISFKGLYIKEGSFPCDWGKWILSTINAATKSNIVLQENELAKINRAILDGISAKGTSRSKLQLEGRASHTNLHVSENKTDFFRN